MSILQVDTPLSAKWPEIKVNLQLFAFICDNSFGSSFNNCELIWHENRQPKYIDIIVVEIGSCLLKIHVDKVLCILQSNNCSSN